MRKGEMNDNFLTFSRSYTGLTAEALRSDGEELRQGKDDAVAGRRRQGALWTSCR